MLFSSLTFLVWFLPAVILLHAIVPKGMKNALLLCASVFFYAWGEIGYVPLVLLSMLANQAFGRGCASDRPAVRAASLAGSLLINIGSLLYFKYAAFLMTAMGLGAYAPDVALPLGISFYTFQTQAYVIDVYRRRVPPESSFIDYATFILLFPQLIAGPIVLYTDVRRELKERRVGAEGMETGMMTFLFGLSAKVLLANPLGSLWEQVQGLAAPSTAAAWLGILAFGLQIYFDFAGYSLMAVGMGNMLGFKFPQNFNNPYAAVSIQDFWRRWHMTLGSWFREYVYIPLGGSRGGQLQTLRNLFVVWLLTGFWHGASWNFIAWGLWFFVFLALERLGLGRLLERGKILRRAYTLLVVFLGWVLFARDSLGDAWAYAGRMFRLIPGVDWQFLLRNHAVLLLLAALACVPRAIAAVERLLRAHAALRVIIMLGALLLCAAGLVHAKYNPFLYFRF